MPPRASAPTAAVTVAIAIAAVAVAASPAHAKPSPPKVAPPQLAPSPALDVRTLAARLLGAALTERRALTVVTSLADGVGPRLAGSRGAERAVTWAVDAMRAAGLENVHTEPVNVPRWIRGAERAEIVAPVEIPLHVTALGGSVATPSEGLTAEVVEVASLEDLKAQAAKDPGRFRGKIVLYNKVMVRSHGFDGYGNAVDIRRSGASEAARVGAVGALIRSVGTGNYRLPHTGATRYEPSVPKIPAGALAAEDADLLHRLLAAGRAVTIRVALTPSLAPEKVPSANVVGELRGRERPDEIVLIGAHLDSWDLGAGALDDGAGCAIVLETARLLRALAGAHPRRTVRVVLFMNEEFGLSGAFAYADAHRAELARHVAALEADAGAGRPTGVVIAGSSDGATRLRPLLDGLAAVVPGEVRDSEEAGADLLPIHAEGVPVLAIEQDVWSYFDWHHTAGDTVDKIDPHELSLATAAFATLTFLLADAPTTLPRAAPHPLPRRPN
jgi:hypothetical protein